MIDWVQDREEFAGLVCGAECGERENGPDCGMGILTTVFADAGEEFYPNRFFDLRKGNGP